MRRSSLPTVVLAGLLFLGALSAPGADVPAKPTQKEIAAWIAELADSSFAVREKASKKLWQAGEAAEPALEEALKSDDAEVVRRARDLLDRFRWGIYADTPADVVALIREYQSGEPNARLEVVQKLLRRGTPGLQAVLKIAASEKNEHQQRLLAEFISARVPAVLVQVLPGGDFGSFEKLLERGHDAGVLRHNTYAAYWLLRDRLDERIAHFRARLDRNAEDRRAAETLAYLYRAKDDLPAARKAAEKSGRHDLLEGILYEMGDWKALAARPERPAQEGTENSAFRAAYARLAGDEKQFERYVDELRKAGESKAWDHFVAVKALLLNDRAEDGLTLLARMPLYHEMLFDIRLARLEYRQALELAKQPRPDVNGLPSPLDLARARALCSLGEKDKGVALFKEYGRHIKDGVNDRWAYNLIRAEYRAGLRELAFEHTANLFGVSPQKSVGRMNGPWEGLFFSELFPKQSESAGVWWTILRQKFKEEEPAAVLKRLRSVLEGKAAARDVRAWIEEAERTPPPEEPGPAVPPANAASNQKETVARRLLALAEAAHNAGLEDLASSLAEKADTPAALLHLGDWHAAKKQWPAAARHYRRAWQKSLPSDETTPSVRALDPLPLYLAGHALEKAGKADEGRKLMEQAHWVTLGDAAQRFAFLRTLAERGHKEAARRETELMLRVSEPNSYYSGAALRRLAVAAAARKDYARAAEGFEQSMLRCLHASTNFVVNGAYVAIPAQVHQMRAAALLSAGKVAEAKKQIDLALACSPAGVDLAILLVPELERRGLKKEAAALFARCYDPHDRLCADYPRCAWGHNSAAWVSACCRRNLDRALEHAKKAVAMAPDNAGFLDTLAEVHFQRGDKEKAVELQKRVVELDPKKTYFRKQLRRIEAGDPAAPRPTEDDE